MSLMLTEDDLQHPEILGEKLLNLAEIVVRKHFYASYNMLDDLRSVAVLKAMKSIREGKYDKSKGAFYNYIYTGMRNEIHNFLYHENKYVPVEDMQKYDVSKEIEYFQESDVCEIDIRIVSLVCDKFKSFGDVRYLVVSMLKDMGFSIRGECSEGSCLIEEVYGEGTLDSTIGKLCGCVVWEAVSRDKLL